MTFLRSPRLATSLSIASKNFVQQASVKVKTSDPKEIYRHTVGLANGLPIKLTFFSFFLSLALAHIFEEPICLLRSTTPC